MCHYVHVCLRVHTSDSRGEFQLHSSWRVWRDQVSKPLQSEASLKLASVDSLGFWQISSQPVWWCWKSSSSQWWFLMMLKSLMPTLLTRHINHWLKKKKKALLAFSICVFSVNPLNITGGTIFSRSLHLCPKSPSFMYPQTLFAAFIAHCLNTAEFCNMACFPRPLTHGKQGGITGWLVQQPESAGREIQFSTCASLQIPHSCLYSCTEPLSLSSVAHVKTKPGAERSNS